MAMDNINITVDMTVPQQIIDSLRETSRFLAKELVRVSPESADECVSPILEMSSQLCPEARLTIDEIVSLLRQEKPN